MPATGSTTIRAIATDRFGNDGPLAELAIAVVPNQPPTISFVRLSPPSGPLTNRQPFSLQVSARDDLAVTNVSVVGLGALTFATNLTSGATNVLSFVVPSNAVPGSLLQFRAQATDGLGVQTAEVVIDFELRDSLPPQLPLLSPAANAVVNPAQPLELVVLFVGQKHEPFAGSEVVLIDYP